MRRRAHQDVEAVQVALIEFGGTVVLSAIEQAPFAAGAEATSDPVDGRVMHAQYRCRLVGGAAAEEIEHDQIADADTSRATAAQLLAQLQ